ncbi:hypothetical protein EDB85DRAFT_1870089, partial [Lactarius pseudohatsudake]
IDSLRRLHRKAKTVDASSFDPGAEPTTTRAAWDKVRDNLEREAKTQQFFVDILDNDVIKPLAALKETKDETRKRIDEDLKASAARYAEYAENRISKLQQVYLKKYRPQQYAHFTEDSQRPQNRPSPSHIPSSGVAETTSAYAYSSLISSPQPAEVQVMGSSTIHLVKEMDALPITEMISGKAQEPLATGRIPYSRRNPVNVFINSNGAKTVDASFGPRAEPTTTRVAWNKVRDDLERVSDDDCRGALSYLNTLRLMWAENLGDGYDCLEGLVFTSTVKDVLVKYMDGMISTCTKHDELAMSTRAEVEKALAGTDTSDLRGSFRRALSFSIPPRTLYHSYRPGEYSDLIFGVPLVDVETDEDNVPKVMRMCIEEVEKRGLNTKGIYSLRRRCESERPFSFGSTDNIYSVAGLLKCYLWDLPEPLFMLSLQDYRNYKQDRARFTENNFSLLRSKILKLHPIHRASLRALLRHLLRVSSHSDTNATTVDALAGYLCYAVLRGNTVLVDGGLVLEDLIQNVHTLFDERPSPPPPVPSPHMAETTSTYTYGSFLTEVMSVPPISVAERWPGGFQSQVPTHPEAVMIPRSPSDSVLYSTSDFPLSSATSLRTAIRPFST